jgi:hypothetical protein
MDMLLFTDLLIQSMLDLLDPQIQQIKREYPGLSDFWAKFTAKLDVIFEWAGPEHFTEISAAITELFARHELVYPVGYFRDAEPVCPYFRRFKRVDADYGRVGGTASFRTKAIDRSCSGPGVWRVRI